MTKNLKILIYVILYPLLIVTYALSQLIAILLFITLDRYNKAPSWLRGYIV